MKLFSQRMGLKPIKETFQIDSMDQILRNRLWDVFHSYLYEAVFRFDDWTKRAWHHFFHLPIDDYSRGNAFSYVRNYFFQDASWNEVYDFLEFCAKTFPEDSTSNVGEFKEACNYILAEELSGFRFIGDELVPITTNVEIQSIEDAINTAPQEAKEHLKRSLELLSDRKTPDYRNSVKESISAVESIVKRINGKNSGTLETALKEVEDKRKIVLHPALKQGLSKLYAYTNDADGIRHAMMDESTLGSEDAIFMLVSCSSFVNYLMVKAEKAKIEF